MQLHPRQVFVKVVGCGLAVRIRYHYLVRRVGVKDLVDLCAVSAFVLGKYQGSGYDASRICLLLESYHRPVPYIQHEPALLIALARGIVGGISRDLIARDRDVVYIELGVRVGVVVEELLDIVGINDVAFKIVFDEEVKFQIVVALAVPLGVRVGIVHALRAEDDLIFVGTDVIKGFEGCVLDAVFDFELVS